MRTWRRRTDPPLSPRDVVVLSAGGNRGAVQVGMLQVLIERNIQPVGYVGCSVGALNAAFMASGTSIDRTAELGEYWRSLRTEDVFPGGNLTRLRNVVRRRSFLHSPDGLRAMIARWAPSERLEDLPIPLRVVTTRLDTGDTVEHGTGPLEPLLLASAALPAIFPPVWLPDGEDATHPHVDGGISSVVPLAAAAALQPSRVFVLDATVPVRVGRMRNPMEVLVASLGAATRSHRQESLGPGVEVHRLSCPDLGVRLVDFSRTEEHIALGRLVAHELLDELAGNGRIHAA
ncbi:MAG TPA: patatin-like phospholipase family protein [Nocardioides sp.]|nr:patatin-like phospholipase family protein [Nocardioides sp.]